MYNRKFDLQSRYLQGGRLNAVYEATDRQMIRSPRWRHDVVWWMSLFDAVTWRHRPHNQPGHFPSSSTLCPSVAGTIVSRVVWSVPALVASGRRYQMNEYLLLQSRTGVHDLLLGDPAGYVSCWQYPDLACSTFITAPWSNSGVLRSTLSLSSLRLLKRLKTYQTSTTIKRASNGKTTQHRRLQEAQSYDTRKGRALHSAMTAQSLQEGHAFEMNVLLLLTCKQMVFITFNVILSFVSTREDRCKCTFSALPFCSHLFLYCHHNYVFEQNKWRWREIPILLKCRGLTCIAWFLQCTHPVLPPVSSWP